MPSSHCHTNGHSTTMTNGHCNGQAAQENGHRGSGPAENVGILAMELYFPSTYVEQSELEAFDGVSPQKYTVGLGQQRMGFCTDREDIVSFSLTVVERLMKRTGTSYRDIGRVDVGTETLIDKSKSVKSCLMQLFDKSGNRDVEGVDNLNACYGGTAALFNCIDWVESSAWDGRFALVVAADIAVYATGNARCTGGAGAVAMLIGPQAAVVFDQGVRCSFMQHAYDFYKPNMASEYPTVDGQLSIRCYMEALDHCYRTYRHKYQEKIADSHHAFSVEAFDYLVFHSPYTKLVQKSLARLVLHDFLESTAAMTNSSSCPSPLETYRTVPWEETYGDKKLEKVLVEESQQQFADKTEASLMVAKNVGNMYTASLYGGLASLLANHSVDEVSGKRVGFFSYGSGVAASLFSARFVPCPALRQLVHSFKSLRQRLDQRKRLSPATFDAIMKHKEEAHQAASSKPVFEPTATVDDLEDAVYYLQSIDGMYRRQYAFKSATC